MSVDPLAAAGGADLAALINAELASLAADAQALFSLLVEDAVVTAHVLPSNGLTDLLEIAGRRVAASLPPTVRPGDVLQVRVTGFDGERILLQIVATGAGASSESGAPAYVPVAPNPAPFVAAPIPPLPGGAQAQPQSQPAAAPSPPVGAAGAAPAAAAATAPVLPGGGATLGAAISRATVAPPSNEPVTPRGDAPPRDAVLRAVVATGQPTTIETRLAASRAATAPSVPAPSASPPAPAATNPGAVLPRTQAAPPVVPPAASPPPPRATTPFVAPPQIATKIAPHQNDVLARAVGRAVPAPSAAAASATPAVAAARTGLAAYAEPVALLRALRLAVTPSNVASATLALERPERLPNALAALERALPRAAADPHIATLRTLLAFVGRIDPRSPALAAQIAAYVDHVVDGSEPKLATLLAAARAAETPLPETSTAPGPSAAPPQVLARGDAPVASPLHARADAGPQPRAGAPAAPPNANAGRPAPVALPPPTLPAALAAERSAALSTDLKQTLLIVAANPATPASVAPALAGAIGALTAVQVTAAQTLAANPNGIAFTIPLTTQHGPASARINVSREAPRHGTKLDGENFRIAFVLDTAHFGTVAIDLVTVGRDVTVDVRAESAPAMRAFRDALGGLTARLESLRYRVASAGASVGVTSTVGVDAAPAATFDPNALVDRSA
jgi:hypothetical protein